MAYLLDTDVFIQAKNFHYGFDFCPAFWTWLERENKAGQVFSVEKVSDEITAGNDELTKWASKQGAKFFLVPDSAHAAALAKTSQWVTSQSYSPAAIHRFLQVADYYLIAYAVAHQHTIVTHEVSKGSPNFVKIPDVCQGVGVKCITPFQMLRRAGAKFILST